RLWCGSWLLWALWRRPLNPLCSLCPLIPLALPRPGAIIDTRREGMDGTAGAADGHSGQRLCQQRVGAAAQGPPATDNPLTALHHLRAAVASCDVRSAFRLLVTAPVDVNADVVGAVASTAPAGPGITRGGAGRTGQRLLHVACERGDEAMVELLLLWGAVVNVADAEGRTPMQVALQHGNHGCSKLLASRCVAGPILSV
ncbi:unnamed protein product, partial [Closterium sp. NIES-53]